ncbi:LysR substrate-binding domain-containing protein [Pseudomonas sp. TH15]|nr:LysR substrate-binding domain-containing protein [Pseudomonas sp. TH15]
MLEAARLGYGVALTRRSIAHAMIQRGQLVRLTDVEPVHASRYFMLWPTHSRRSAQLASLLTWLRQQIIEYQDSIA